LAYLPFWIELNDLPHLDSKFLQGLVHIYNQYPWKH
jgi:hypothetical protein